jgi:hypothetical protein
LFKVNVATGQVTVSPSTGQSRAIFAGSAIGFNTSVLLDQSGTPGLKALNVSLTNNWGVPIGVDTNGNPTGLKVLFSGITNSSSFSSPAPLANVSTDGNATGPTATVSTGGAVYAVSYATSKIYKIVGANTSVLAGSGTGGSTNGTGTAASFKNPFGMALNPIDGSLVVADQGNNLVRRVTTAGRVTTIAGTGATGEGNGTGNTATFTAPTGVAVDSSGNIYVSDFTTGTIRKITLNSGQDPSNPANYQVSLIAGGPPGFADGVGTGASFSGPSALATDTSGNVYVADYNNNRVRRMTSAGEVVTIGGTGAAIDADGPGNTATFNHPSGITWFNGALFVSDVAADTVRQMTVTGNGSANQTSAASWLVQTLAGTSGSAGSTNGAGNVATLSAPWGISSDKSGDLYVADYNNNAVREITPANGNFPVGTPTGSSPTDPVLLSNPTGQMPTAATNVTQPFIAYSGALAAGATSAAQQWAFIVPSGVTAFQFTVTVEADTSITAPPTSGTGVGSANTNVRTLAGNVLTAGFINGDTSESRFNGPRGVAVDAAGNTYIADTANFCIRRISSSGLVSTIAGSPINGSNLTDGYGNVAAFGQPAQLAVTADGTTIFVADESENAIRIVTFKPQNNTDPTNPANWSVATIAGNGTIGGAYSTPTSGTSATFYHPYGICIDQGGNVDFTEIVGNRIRQLRFLGGDKTLASNWEVYLLAGDTSSNAGAAGDVDGSGTGATFRSPAGICADARGNVYVADSDNHRVRVVSIDGTTSTLAGGVSGDTPTTGYVDGAGPTARFGEPEGVAIDSSGMLYVADLLDGRVRSITPAGTVATVAGAGSVAAGNSPSDGAGNAAQFNGLYSIGTTVTGDVLVCDTDAIREVERIVATGTQ